jgi:hypothetical protein
VLTAIEQQWEPKHQSGQQTNTRTKNEIASVTSGTPRPQDVGMKGELELNFNRMAITRVAR